MDLTNKKIFIFLQRNWGRKIGYPIAKKFANEGASLGALTFQKDYHQTYLESDLKFDWLMSHDDIINNPKLFLKDDEISIKEICENLKIKSIWPYVQSLREHVKNYNDKFFFGSYKQNVSDENILLYVKSAYKLIVKIEREFSPEIFILPNFVSIIHIFTYLFCKTKNIKIFAYSSSPLKGKSIFVRDFNDSTGKFFEDIDKYNSKNELPLNTEKVNEYLKNELQKFDSDTKKINQKLNLFGKTKTLIKQIYKSLVKKNKPHHKQKKKLFGANPDNLEIKYLIRDYISYNLNCIKTKKTKFYNLEDIDNFAYMPLQYQPEANIDVTSASFNNQIETARQIAMNLPGDMTLVVKDHPEMFGLRSYKYLEKILKTPNIKLIDSSYKGTYVVKKAKIIIAPTGSTFFEAALIKKPGLILGNLGTARMLPNVLKIDNYKEIQNKVDEIINSSKEWNEEYIKKLKIIVGCSFEVSIDNEGAYSRIWETSYSSDKDLNYIYRKFKEEVMRLL